MIEEVESVTVEEEEEEFGDLLPDIESLESPRVFRYADYQPIEKKVCAMCKRVRSMSKYSDYQFSKEYGDCLDCVYLHGKNRKQRKSIGIFNEEFRLSALHPPAKKGVESPRDRSHSLAYDRIVINTIQEGVKLFYELDRDCNGTLSKAELIHGLSSNKKLREVRENLFIFIFFL